MCAKYTPRTCEYCKKEFMARTRSVRIGGGKFCSRPCASASRRVQKASRTCEHCGSDFECYPSDLEIRPVRFCSPECRNQYRVREVIDNGDGTATIPLTQNKVAIIDSADIEIVSGMTWGAVQKDNNWYAATKVSGETIYLHRLIDRTPPGLDTDHIDGDGLNNRRYNLRSGTRAQNVRNQSGHKDRSAPFKGIAWSKAARKWQARIMVNRKAHYLGLFEDPEDAARAYDRAAKELHGEFARLNFPDE